MHLRMGKGITKKFCFLISLVLALGLYGASTTTVLAHPASWVQDTIADFDTGTWSGVVITYEAGGEVQLDIEGYYLYAFQGQVLPGKKFWRYNTLDNTWETLADAPLDTVQGAALAYDGGNYIYALRGSGNIFMRYDIEANTWVDSYNNPTELSSLPYPVGYGGDLVFYHLWDDEPQFYAVRGNNTNNFLLYDALDDHWEIIPYPTQYIVSYGGSLACNEYIDPDLFLLHGNGQFFSSYSTGSYQWTMEVATPANVSYGGALAYDPAVDFVNFYALRGGNQTGFWRYNPSSWWVARANTPYSVGYGGDLAGDGLNFFYALRGGNTNTFMRYDPLANIWLDSNANPGDVAPCPGNVYIGGALTRGDPQYYASGTFTSSVHDAGDRQTVWGTTAWTATLNGQTITMKVRTGNSADMSDATAWASCPAATSGADISGLSSVTDGHRYIQYRAELSTSNTSQTPLLEDVTINYFAYLLGDANGNGVLDSPDITYMEHVVAQDPAYSICNWCCDANQDSGIDCRDITKTEILLAGAP